jgi:hypothetical protein
MTLTQSNIPLPLQKPLRPNVIPPPPPFQQIHPAFQGTYKRYSNQPQHCNIPHHHPQQQQQQEFNASAISPMFYGYTSSPPFSKL